ncbi:rab11 family-interacting protein 1 isoform X1 [Betta splendens]|uniref:Rab11 family-interacting protein 1 isoform X1 n=1 Tax=Betta splendens TaxID=158456 RepID=A0A6P7LKQ3_BETSP|nr:rab11 family-interacting protein 1 isoform X1 [Betta splendens]
MSSPNGAEDQKWVPTHVQVTVLKGRGLRGKGKHGTSDAYTIIQLGKEKYWTCVVEKSTEPEWREECSFELQSGALQSGHPAAGGELVLTVMHRALIGLDVFLGQAVIPLDKLFAESRCARNEWYRLNSKTGKKEKERGDIQVTIQFTRNNLTASMYDLVMKDKGTSTFSKLKERMKGKRKSSEEDSSSAVLPGGYGSLYRMRQRLPSDGGGEEDYEDDEGGEVRRSKMRTFFLRGKLRKSSDTRSSTSLGSESSESSSRGGSLSPTAGISVVVSDLSNSPSNSSNLTADNSPEHTANTSPKSASLKCDFGNEAGEITIAVPQPTLCVNGSHAYTVQPLGPGSGRPADLLGVGQLHKSLPLSLSLQNLSPRASTDPLKGPVGDGRRWSFDKPGEEEKAAIAAALQQSGPMLGEQDERSEQAAPPRAASTTEAESQGKKQRRNFFSHGRNESPGRGPSHCKDEPEQAPAAAEEKHKGWFGSKDSHSKPSPVMPAKLEPSTEPYPPCASLVSPLHHTNPFYQSQTTTPTLSPRNPFFSFLQQIPSVEDALTPPLNPPPPPLPFLSSSRPAIGRFFPQASYADPTLSHDHPATDGEGGAIAKAVRQRRPPALAEGERPFGGRMFNPFLPAREPEWDDSFEAFAAGRLHSLEDTTPGCTNQPTPPGDRPLENRNDARALPPRTDADRGTNVSDATQPQAHKATSQVSSTNKQMLETIPEHLSFESDHITLNAPSDSLTLDACSETTPTNGSGTNTNDSPSTNVHQTSRCILSMQLDSSSPDPGSSGLGSSAEEDFPSCPSSHSDKLSASSCEEAESSILSFEKSSEPAEEMNVEPSEPGDDVTDRRNDLSSVDLTLQTLVDPTTSPDQQLMVTAGQNETQGENTLNVCDEVDSDLFRTFKRSEPHLISDFSSQSESGQQDADEFSVLMMDFSNSPVNNEHVMNPAAPEHQLCSMIPSLFITTSSPDARRSFLDSPLESTTLSQDTSQLFMPFGEFLTANPFQDLNGTLLDSVGSDQRPGSFLQSLYVSTDSQIHQIGESEVSSTYFSVLEPSEMLHCRGEDDNKATVETVFLMKGDFKEAQTGSTVSCNPSKISDGGVESQHVISGGPQAQPAPLQRSQSEGTLTPSFGQVLLPSFGSDPGAVKEPPTAQPGPDLLCLSSCPLSLTPDNIRSPAALCSLPANAPAKPPPTSAPDAAPKPRPLEPKQQQAANQQNSPHPVKPLTTATAAEEKRAEGRSVLATGLEKLKSTIHPGRSSQQSEQEPERRKGQSLTEGAGSYYHLTHSELIALLVQREGELARHRQEFEKQRVLLAKRETELKRLKPQVRDLEDYIDTLLVRIMEQKPTLLQVRSKFK